MMNDIVVTSAESSRRRLKKPVKNTNEIDQLIDDCYEDRSSNNQGHLDERISTSDVDATALGLVEFPTMFEDFQSTLSEVSSALSSMDAWKEKRQADLSALHRDYSVRELE